MEIDITGINLIEFVKEVYKLSVPVGLGWLHFTKEELTDEEAKEILDVWKNDRMLCLDMDYIKGRACKMYVFKEGKKLNIRVPWYDHTDIQLKKLLKAVWPKDKPFPELEPEEHGIACHCIHCQSKRRTKT